MARLTLAIGAATALLCAGVNTTAAQESAARTPVTNCADAGPGFIRLLDFSTCIRLGLDVTAAFADDVAQSDVYANAMRNADGSPAVAYGTESRTGNKHKLGGYVLLRPHLSMVTPTDYGPLWIHVRPSNTSVVDEFSPAEVGPVFVDDAWASMGAFTLGRRFSFFDYNPGFNHKPGYTSYRTTNVLALTAPVTDGLSATLALEDGSYRRVVLIAAAKPVGDFVERHPTVKMLALSFLVVIGTTLVADGFGVHFDHAFIYVAMAFSCAVEALNMVARRRAAATIRMANLDLKQMRGPDSPKRMRACGEHASASQAVHRGFSYAARPPLLTTRVCDIAAIRDSDAASLRLLRAPMPRKQAPWLDERSEPSAFAKAATAGCGPCGYRS